MRLHTKGDHSGRLLAWLLREEWQHAPIGAICLTDGTVVSSQEAINNAFKDYYMGLYQQQPECDAQQLESFLSEALLIKLSAPHVAVLDKPLRSEEIAVAITQIAHNKTPGMDGLPIRVLFPLCSAFIAYFAVHA
ncbi:hypothetical protein NDU88_000782 [Pleurodeles waltl]|uniref:Reverse transcriptase n=1 Tax=Pleurodeles waltl TaxID=8319 RepID=A0AAV7L7U5_PLEWA|nr:hypothetical protein NDU88_000782 [Pleurodeles waltl]